MIQTYSSRYNRHRTGQALLLAVLVMVFAALIGVTFITVVAVNIGQTGREEERDKARQAAEAGLAFANLQLTNGIRGIRWRPEQEIITPAIPIPVQGPPAATNVFYWTPFDQAQGWAGYNGQCDTPTGTCEGNFVKFPDPRSTNPTINAPNYMLKVEKILPNDPVGDNATGDKTGGLRITSIGLSPDDPNVFYKVVAYKSGFAQSPFTGAMRSVSNWDFEEGGVPSAKTNGASSGTTMSIQNRSVKFPTGNFYVTIGNPGGTLRQAFVTSATATTLTFATDPGGWVDQEHVEIAATIGAPLAVDYDRDGIATAGTDPDVLEPEEIRLDISDNAAATPGSTWVNGSLIFSGNTLSQNLRAPQVAGTNPIGQLRASGLIQVVDADRTKISGIYEDGNPSGLQKLLSSTAAEFPFTGSDVRALSIISDGANRLSSSPDPTRQNKPFTPPNLMGGGDGFGRYRQLTKYSRDGAYDALNDGVADSLQSSAYGYGEGIYINNPQDKERIYDTAIPGYREMNALEFHELIFSNEDSKTHLRLGTPEAKATLNKSLEEQHIRGWVSPSEFRARGALIEFDAALGKIYITKESRTDGRQLQSTPDPTVNIYANEGTVPTQGWYGPDGTLLGGTYGGVYRQEFDWPENGVIFAEGNIRIRGEMPTATRSLTVVSMNNIYVEGSLSAGTRKILLLAKKNVLVNPTRVLGSIDDQTRLASAPGAGDTSIEVTDASAFRVGDWAEIKLAGGASVRRTITGVNAAATPNTVTFSVALPANTYLTGQVVQLVQDPTFIEAGNLERPFSQNAIRIAKFDDVIQRRLHLAAGTTQIRLAMRHNAERKAALTVGTQPPGAPPAQPTLNWARMANRLGTNPGQTALQTTEKLLNVEYNQSPGGDGDDTFPNSTVPATQGDAVAFKLSDLEANMETEHPNTQWQYDVSIQNAYNVGPNLPPFFFLSSVGNRHEWLIQPTGTLAFPDRKDVMGTGYPVPMATSVQAFLNGAPMSLGLFDPTSVLRQFGFNPLFLATDPDEAQEDVLTSDQGFYQSVSGNPATTAYTDLLTHDNTNYTLDSRIMQVAGTTNGIYDLAMHLNNSEVVPGSTVENYFNATTTADIPYYRLSRMKLENADLFATDGSPNTLTPGYTFNIQAFVYAQEGSWLVIPGDLFDSKVKAGYVDLNNNGSQDTAMVIDYESLDLNRDGVVSADEQIAPLRFARYNYQINFRGAIMENQTAPVNAPGGTAIYKGAVAEWTDKWATISQDFTTAASPTYGSIKYEFDPTAITAALVPATPLNTDIGFQPPISPDLIYQTG